MTRHSKIISAALVVMALASAPAPLAAQVREAVTVSLVADRAPGRAAVHGLEKLKQTLRDKGVAVDETASLEAARGDVLIIAGISQGPGAAAAALQTAGIAPPTAAESLLIRHDHQAGKQRLIICGADDRGLMYALLDVADRVGWTRDRQNPLSDVRDMDEKPAVAQRAVSTYAMNRRYFESRLYDEKYWERYLDTLARNRFNSFVVIFGYENGGFLAPPYPYFFDVEGFADVRMVGLTPGEQRRNLDALNRLIELCHDRGIEFTAGIWDHIYRGGVQAGGIAAAENAPRQPTHGLVWGVTTDNLNAYTIAALTKLLKVVPNLDALQFRMHDESGLKEDEMDAFWREVFAMIKQTHPDLRVDARAKGLPDSVIDSAVEAGIRLRIATKYWMEQMGLPFHPTHVNQKNQHDRRHGYADLLRHPQRYPMLWRLWNGGTTRILLWGDPDYARRFATSTQLYGGEGFEINEPLATKMLAQPHEQAPFDLLNPPYRYYEYEFERYWHFFQVFGRLGYNPDTPAEVWDREFSHRFGPEAGPHLEAALHRASQVLPRIVATCYPYTLFPSTRGWAEKQHLSDLAFYAKAEGTDVAQFAGFKEEAELLLAGQPTAKTRPLATSDWFAQTAAAILRQVAEAERLVGDQRGKEFDSTVVDLRILAHLASYHARRIPAAVSYNLYKITGDPNALDDAIGAEQHAIGAWRELVAAAGDVYAPDLMMGVRNCDAAPRVRSGYAHDLDLSGHWRDELGFLEKGLAELKQERAGLPAAVPRRAPRPVPAATGDVAPPEVIHERVTSAQVGAPIRITAIVRDPSGVASVRLRYRGVTQFEDYRSLEMNAGAGDRYEAVVPADQIDPKWDFMYYIEAVDRTGNGRIFPDFEKETPYVMVPLIGR